MDRDLVTEALYMSTCQINQWNSLIFSCVQHPWWDRFNGHPWPSPCTFTLLLKYLSWSPWSHLELLLLTNRTASCKTFVATTWTCQDKLPAVLTGTKFILIPQHPTVSACWREEEKKKLTPILLWLLPCRGLAKAPWGCQLSFKWLLSCRFLIPV